MMKACADLRYRCLWQCGRFGKFGECGLYCEYLTVSAGHADINAATVLVHIVRLTLRRTGRHRVHRQVLELRITALSPRRRHVRHLYTYRVAQKITSTFLWHLHCLWSRFGKFT